MNEHILTVHEARLQWRQLTTGTIAGKTTIVTRYGDEIAAVVPIEEYRQMKAALDELKKQERAAE